MKMFQEELIKNLPDCYRKDEESNNYKLLNIFDYYIEKMRSAAEETREKIKLDNATGKTLDLYGEMVGQVRGQATDDQFRMLIKTKIVRNICSGSHKSMVDSLAAILNCKSSDISIKDTPDKMCSVTIGNVPLGAVLTAGMSTSQFEMLIKSLLPAGVTFEPFTYDGTFTFSTVDNEYNEAEGFSDVEGGDIGGYLGVVAGAENDIILPI